MLCITFLHEIQCASPFFLSFSSSWPKIHIYIVIHQNRTLFLQETVKLLEKGREPKMQFNTQFQAHYLSLSINLAMVQKVAHNSLKCWLNSSRLQYCSLSQYDCTKYRGSFPDKTASQGFHPQLLILEVQLWSALYKMFLRSFSTSLAIGKGRLWKSKKQNQKYLCKWIPFLSMTQRSFQWAHHQLANFVLPSWGILGVV